MQINIYRLNEMPEDKKKVILKRAEVDIENFKSTAADIIEDVKENGDSAVIKYTKKFDKAEFEPVDLKVKQIEFETAEKRLDKSVKEAVEISAKNIKKFHESQIPEDMWFTDIDDGIIAGEKVTPVTSVGLYVPRGKGSFPSVMLMLCIPAVAAKVEKISVFTPPRQDGTVDDASLVAAKICGVKDIYKVGGVQAIAAAAYGTEVIPKADKIIGPGSAYVTAAKRLLYGIIDVGPPAGPSESIILADEKTEPRIAALDLLIEAEHGPDSTALLVTHSYELAVSVKNILPELVENLTEERKGFIKENFMKYSGIILTESIEESIKFVNEFAPEHLEVLVEEPFSVLGKIKNAGEIMLGKYTPITISNFSLGPNAILPTGGFAKTFSCVSVYDFLKRSSIGYLTEEGYNKLKNYSRIFAEFEGFPAHAQAIAKREL